jgi:hypothetical protein
MFLCNLILRYAQDGLCRHCHVRFALANTCGAVLSGITRILRRRYFGTTDAPRVERSETSGNVNSTCRISNVFLQPDPSLRSEWALPTLPCSLRTCEYLRRSFECKVLSRTMRILRRRYLGTTDAPHVERSETSGNVNTTCRIPNVFMQPDPSLRSGWTLPTLPCSLRTCKYLRRSFEWK